MIAALFVVIDATLVPETPSTVPVPTRAPEAPPPLELMVMVPAKLPAAVGVNRTTTVWLPPAARLNGPPDATVKGAVLDVVPVRTRPPEFVTVRDWSPDVPIATVPKSTAVWGATDRVGGVLTAFAVAALRASISAPRSLPSVPTFL
jgi:hypothetical protein